MLIVLLFLLFHLDVFSQSLESYVQSYLVQNNYIKIKDSSLESFKKQSIFLDRYYKGSLSLTPSWENNNYLFPNGHHYNLNSYQLTSELNQKFQTGTNLSLSAGWNRANRTDQNQSQDNYDFSLGLSQSLVQNFWGKDFKERFKINSLESQVELNQNEQRINNACLTAAKTYLLGHVRQEKLQLYEKLLSKSKQIYNYQKDRYYKKLEDKIDFLQAKVNYQEAQGARDSASHRLLETLSEVQAYSDLKNFEDPLLDIKNPQNKNSLSLKTKKDLLAFYQAQGKRLERKNQFDISLNLWGGYSQKKNDYSFSNVGDNEKENFGIGLNFDFLLSDSESKLEIERKKAQAIIAQYEIEQVYVQLAVQQKVFQTKMDHLKEKIELSIEQEKILSQLHKEAERKFFVRKISLKDYLMYRSNHIRKQIEIVENQYLLNDMKLSWFQELNIDPGFCFE